MLKQEISAIRDTLEEQLRIVRDSQSTTPIDATGRHVVPNDWIVNNDEVRAYPARHGLHYTYNTRHRPRLASERAQPPVIINNAWDSVPNDQPPIIDSSAIHDILYQDSLALIQKRIQDFSEMNDWATHLETWVSLTQLRLEA